MIALKPEKLLFTPFGGEQELLLRAFDLHGLTPAATAVVAGGGSARRLCFWSSKARGLAEQADDALGHEEHDQDEHHAQDDQPVVREFAASPSS